MAFDVNAVKDRAARLTRALNPAQMIAVGLLAVVTLIGGMAFMRWASTPSYSVLFTGLDAKGAQSVVDKLKADKVPYKLADQGSAVLVPQAKVYELRLSLSAAGLPKGGKDGYELLDKQSFTTSDFTQKVDYQRAIEGELARTLMALDGVDDASVHLAVPQESLFTDNKQPTRASVLLKTSTDLSDDAVQSIVNLVSSAVPNLSPNDVTVADTAGRVLSSPGTSSGATSTRQMQQAGDYQRQLGSDASAMLAQVFGPGHAVVRVSAKLNFDETEKQTDTYAKGAPQVLNEQNATETFSGSGTPPSGTLGVTGAPAATTTGANNSYTKNDSSKQYGADHTVETSKSAPGKVERLSAAVVLDASAQPVPPADKVEKLVGAALGIDPARGDTIVVDTIAFDSSTAKAARAARARADGTASTDALLGYVRTAVGALALLLVLFFLSRGLKRRAEPVALPAVGPGSVAAAIAAAQSHAAGALAAGAADAGTVHPPAVPAAPAAAGLGLPVPAPAPAAVATADGEDELLHLIDQQPEEMAVLLRSWLADRRS